MVKRWRNWKLCVQLGEMYSGTATMKNSMWFFKILKIGLLHDPLMSLLGIYLKKGPNVFHIHSSITDNTQKMGEIQVPLSEWKDEQNMVYTYNETLLSLKKEKHSGVPLLAQW